MKRQSSEWEKIFSNKAPDKGFISKMYKPLTHLNIQKKKKTQSKNGQMFYVAISPMKTYM